MNTALRAVSATLLAFATVGGFATTIGFAVERELFVARATGYVAIVLVLSSLSVSPLARWVPVAWRRAFGLAAALAAGAHVAFVMSTPLYVDLRQLIEEPQLRAGFAALAILAILFATSFPKHFRVPNWKPLHRLSYAAGLLALHHLALSPLAPPWWVAAFAIWLAILLGARVLTHVTRRRAGAGV